MKVLNIYIVLLLFLSPNIRIQAQYIVVDETYSPQQLIQNVLVNSPCASVSNFSISGGNFGTSEQSFAYFNANNTTFPFAEGIVLTTGKAVNTVGPNTFLSDDGQSINWNGDTDLQQALNLTNSFNATVLEFDFIPYGNIISFDYIFSSEQYLSNPTPNQCNFTDGFAFLIKEIGQSNYTNIALIPGTTTPVKVNTVRGSGTICPVINETYFDAFNGTEHPTNFNGQTKVLKAQATVTPNVSYHIKLVIADEGNARFDSAIFLGAGSFTNEIYLGPNRLIATGNPLCNSESLTLQASLPNSSNYQWFKDGIAIPNSLSANLTVTEAGLYTVNFIVNGNCPIQGNIEIEKAPALEINQTTFTACDSDGALDGKTSFDLQNIAANLFTNLPSTFSISFFETVNGTTALPNTYVNSIANQQTIYAKVTTIQNCYNLIPVILRVNVINLGNDESLAICNSSNLTLSVPLGFTSYSWNGQNGTNTLIVSNPGTYTVTVTNAFNCSDTKTFTVSLTENATVENIIIKDFSSNNSATIITSGSGLYSYSLDNIVFQDSPTFENLQAGLYTIFIKEASCGTVNKSFYVLDAPSLFSPNEDGFNDVWYIPFLNRYPQAKVTIFDRYGKLIYAFKSAFDAWDGTYNGAKLPATDYWFVAEIETGRTVKGHFSLIR